MPASADGNPTTTVELNQEAKTSLPVLWDSDVWTAPLGSTGSGRSLRGVPPPVPGGGCQASAGFRIPSATVDTVGLGVTLTTSATGISRLENFKVAGSGAQSLTAVSWAGWFQTGTAATATPPTVGNVGPATYASPGTAVLPTGFSVTFYSNVNGEPVQLGLPQTVSYVAGSTPGTGQFVEVVDGTDTVPTGNTAGVLTLAVQNYTAVLATPVSLTGGDCYWIEIRPVAVGSAATPSTLAYFWRTSNQGDGMHIRRLPNALAPGNAPTSRGNTTSDVSFCLSLATTSMADGTACPIGTQMTCGLSPNFVGQLWDGSGAGNATSQVAVFNAADNFTTTAPMTINNICWYGTYIAQAGGPAIPPTDSFRIRVYPDLGGANAGVPSATFVAERFVATTGGTDGLVVRNPQVFNQFDLFLQNANQQTASFSFSTDLAANPIILPTAGCYWLEIAQTTTQAQGVFYVWMGKNNARTTTLADGFRQQVGGPTFTYTQGTQLFSADFVWGFNTAAAPTIVRSTTCVPVQLATNTVCSAAVALTIGAALPTFSNNIGEVPLTTKLPPGCFDDYPNLNGGWFRLTGNGQNVTVSTCLTGADPRAPETNFDTVVGVYCNTNTLATCNTGSFTCIASNDDAPAANCTIAGASTVTFPTVLNQNYFIYVWGFQGAQGGLVAKGYYYVNATTTAGAVAAPACGTIANCRIDIPAGAQEENEACGPAGANESCTGAEILTFNTWATGSLFALDDVNDQDYWHLPDAGSVTTDGGEWFTIDVRSEMPLNFIWFRSQCVDGVLTNGVITTLPQCTDGSTFNVFVPAGGFFVRVEPSGTYTPPCDPTGLNRGNRYVLRVRPAAVGACCVLGSPCSLTVALDGAGLASDPTDCSQRGGTYLGDNSVCQPVDNLPCGPDGGVLPGTVSGSCCNNYGICYVSSDAALTCVNGVFTAAGVCTPPAVAGNPFLCTPSVSTVAQRCCFPLTGVCIVIPQAECTGTGGNTSAGTVCIPNSCPQPANGVCCGGNGVCAVTIASDCPVGNGITFNPGVSSCTPTNPCPQPVACCAADGSCSVVLGAAACDGTPQTGQTTCPPTPACPTGGVNCCRGTTCVVTANCTGGAAVGTADLVVTSCGTGTSLATCCYADFSHTNGLTIDDLFIYLNAYFASSPFANMGGDGVTAPNIDDLFLYINAYFVGCQP